MKENKMMDRFTKYLNKSLFRTQDRYIKSKYQAYLKKTGQAELLKSNFFHRMQHDKEERSERQRIRDEIGHPMDQRSTSGKDLLLRLNT